MNLLYLLLTFALLCHRASSSSDAPCSSVPTKSAKDGIRGLDSVITGNTVGDLKVTWISPQESQTINQYFHYSGCPKSPIVPKQPAPQPPAKNCPKLPVDYVRTAGIGAHKLHLPLTTWDDARNTCIKEGAHLAIIRSAREEAVLQDLHSKNKLNQAWLGVHDQFEEGDWVSVLDEPLQTIGYLKWYKDAKSVEPNNFNGNENCGSLKKGGMDDQNCGTKKPFYCKIDLPADC